MQVASDATDVAGCAEFRAPIEPPGHMLVTGADRSSNFTIPLWSQ
jgi:hypothetical protein